MVISRTPLRISFCGGGSDLSSFYSQEPGAVVSTAINKYIYITVNKKFDNLIRASYSITEIVEKPDDLKHELIRESLKLLGIQGGIEITSIADVPSSGTGLGSSSSYTVGLLNALYAHKNQHIGQERLSEEACKVEIELCHKPIGKQDQYIATYGNLNYIQFNPDGRVYVDPIICSVETRRQLQENLLLLYTGITRSADNILREQNERMLSSRESRLILRQMVGLARDFKAALEKGSLYEFGELLNINWEMKRQLARDISNEVIDNWYKIALENGAIGGKVLGAGGGGFLLLYAPKELHEKIVLSLPELRRVGFTFEKEGSKIIFYGD